MPISPGGAVSLAAVVAALGYTPEQPLTFNGPLARSVNAISMPAAASGQAGYLTAADWATFNGKQAALGYTPVNKAGDTMTGTLGSRDITPSTDNSYSLGTASFRWANVLSDRVRLTYDLAIDNSSGSGSGSGVRFREGTGQITYLYFGYSGNDGVIQTPQGNLLISPATGKSVRVAQAPGATANFGLLSLGSGGFGGGAGEFAGSASGTGLAANFAPGFAGNLIDLQVGGVGRFKIDASANITMLGPNTTIAWTTTAGSARARVDYNGALRMIADVGNIHLMPSGLLWGQIAYASTSWLGAAHPDDRITLGSSGVGGTSKVAVVGNKTTEPPLIVWQPAAHASDTQQWVNSGGAAIAKVTQTGRLYTLVDFVSDDATKGLILKSANGHYWRGTVDNAGALTFADLGTSLPA